MPSLYDENVLGAKERIALAKKLQEQADNQQAGQMVSGWYVPNTGGAVVGALKNIIGAWQEKEAKGDLDKAEREKYGAILRSMNEMGMQAPNEFALKAGTPEQQPSLWERGKAFVTGEDQPQAIPAQPMAQNVAQNVTPQQKENALLGLMNSSPEYAQNILAIEKLKSDQAKALRDQQNEKVPTGFTVNQNGTITPMNINTPTGTMPYTDYQNQLAAAKDKLVGQNISPVELQNMQNQAAHLGIANANLGLAQQSAALQQQRFAQEQQEKADKPLTSEQSNAKMYSDRMSEANKILSNVGSNYSPAAISALNSTKDIPLVGSVVNALSNQNVQKVNQAQSDFINALLRKESGASIAPSEFNAAARQYFPQPGDKPEVIKQKEINRKIALQGIQSGVPKSAQSTPAMQEPQQPTQNKPKIKFLGFE